MRWLARARMAGQARAKTYVVCVYVRVCGEGGETQEAVGLRDLLLPKHGEGDAFNQRT